MVPKPPYISNYTIHLFWQPGCSRLTDIFPSLVVFTLLFFVAFSPPTHQLKSCLPLVFQTDFYEMSPPVPYQMKASLTSTDSLPWMHIGSLDWAEWPVRCTVLGVRLGAYLAKQPVWQAYRAIPHLGLAGSLPSQAACLVGLAEQHPARLGAWVNQEHDVAKHMHKS